MYIFFSFKPKIWFIFSQNLKKHCIRGWLEAKLATTDHSNSMDDSVEIYIYSFVFWY